MRSSSSPRVSRPATPRQQSFRATLQRKAAVREYRTALTAPVITAEYGAKTTLPVLSQLAWNVNRETNKAAQTTISLCFGAIDCGVPIDVVLRAPETLARLIRARAPRLVTGKRRTLKEIFVAETRIESRMNNVQMAIAVDGASTDELLELADAIKDMQRELEAMASEVEQQINDRTMPRDDQPGGVQ